MAWRSPASEVNLGAIDETVVHAQNVTGVHCKIWLYILACCICCVCPSVFQRPWPSVLVPRRIAVCAFRVSLMGGAGEKKKLWVQGLLSVVIMDAYFHVTSTMMNRKFNARYRGFRA